jgi:ATP-dependent Clp protease ATP-binding subunit ClpB
VILFDEIEKAHPDVWNTLLQVLDDGRLTDGQGRTVDFKNTVLILTSNLGTEAAMAVEERADLDDDARRRQVRDVVLEVVRRSFRPEFLNRIDEVVVFQRLGRKEISAIVDIQLGRLRDRLAKRDLKLEVSDGAKERMGDLGWDPQYGARPLKRAIQKNLEDPISLRLLAGDYVSGDTVVVDASGGELVLDRTPGKP